MNRPFVFYVAKSLVCNSKDMLHKGLSYYKEYQGKKKSLWRVYKECQMLYNHWDGAFPNTYFYYCMYSNDYTDVEKMKSFVPQEAYRRFVGKSTYNLLIDDKIICHDVLSYYNIPVPERLFVFRNNEFRCGGTLLTDEQVDAKLSETKEPRIFVKNFTGGGASGISILHFNGERYCDDNGIEVSSAYIKETYKDHSVIFERQIMQHPEMAKFNPDTVNTIRVLTYKNKIIAATVRFGGKGCFVDNISKGGLAVNVDVESGRMSEWGMRKYDIEHYTEHPDTHEKFCGQIVPMWNEAKAVVECCMRYMPYYGSVGYDVAISKDGPLIVEINTGAGIGLSQIGMERGLARIFGKQLKF
jgi:Ni,Fe-hydrogenase I large subunit